LRWRFLCIAISRIARTERSALSVISAPPHDGDPNPRPPKRRSSVSNGLRRAESRSRVGRCHAEVAGERRPTDGRTPPIDQRLERRAAPRRRLSSGSRVADQAGYYRARFVKPIAMAISS